MTGEKRNMPKYGRRVIQYAAGMLSLALVPAFWMIGFRRKRNIQMLSLAVYYAAVMLFGLSGAYPMPLMGFGLSPIAGYWLACVLVTASVKTIA